MHTKTLFWRRFSSDVALAALLAVALPSGVHAATTNITGGTNGASCGSGGYFTPSSVTITSGDTVTISVPSDDPYAFGIQVHGFPEGLFTVLPGHSHTTSALTGDVSYYGTWPNSGCMKGSGSITVNAPTPPPASPPASTPPPTSSSGSTAPTTSAGSASSASSGGSTQVTTPTSDTTPTAPTQSSSTKASEQATKQIASTAPKAQSMPLGLTVALSGMALVVIALAAFVVWRFVLARRLPAQPAQTSPAAIPPIEGGIHQAPDDPAATGQGISKGEDHENESNS